MIIHLNGINCSGYCTSGWTMIHASRRNNGVYVDDVQQREALKEIFVSAGSFLR
jgi:hypothetical protein